MSVKERVQRSAGLKTGLKKVSDAANDMSAGVRTKNEMSYLKKQRKFLFLLGVSSQKTHTHLELPSLKDARLNFADL